MSETIEIPKDTSKKVDEASKILGIQKDKLIDRAILVYLDTISKYSNLKKEMAEWDLLSDEALINFEKLLRKKVKFG